MDVVTALLLRCGVDEATRLRFAEEEVDAEALALLGEPDLLALGVTKLGPRKKLLAAMDSMRNGKTDA